MEECLDWSLLKTLLEEIVGEIDDETDKWKLMSLKLRTIPMSYKRAMSLNDFNEYFGVELESDDVDTIAG